MIRKMIRAIQFQNKRVGSTFLQKAINSHPEIIGIDEVFVNIARKAGMKKSGFIPYVRSTQLGDPDIYIHSIWDGFPDKHVIFKLMYNQITYHNGLYNFIKYNKLPIIHLMRRNIVKQVISGLTAATTKHKPVDISPSAFFQLVVNAHKENEKWKNEFKDHKKLELFYPDIIGEEKNGFTYVSNDANIAICEFFRTDYVVPMYTDTKKKNKRDIWVYLKNREEVEKVFKGSQFEWMLND